VSISALVQISAECNIVFIRHLPVASETLQPTSIAKVTLARTVLGCRPLFLYPQIIMKGNGSETLFKELILWLSSLPTSKKPTVGPNLSFATSYAS
jgi:hypothetical protein